jgi:hypothetical protein
MITLSEGAVEMADIIDYRIEGDDMQLVEVELDPGEGIRAEAGGILGGLFGGDRGD